MTPHRQMPSRIILHLLLCPAKGSHRYRNRIPERMNTTRKASIFYAQASLEVEASLRLLTIVSAIPLDAATRDLRFRANLELLAHRHLVPPLRV